MFSVGNGKLKSMKNKRLCNFYLFLSWLPFVDIDVGCKSCHYSVDKMTAVEK